MADAAGLVAMAAANPLAAAVVTVVVALVVGAVLGALGGGGLPVGFHVTKLFMYGKDGLIPYLLEETMNKKGMNFRISNFTGGSYAVVVGDPDSAKRLLANVTGLTGGHSKLMGAYPLMTRGHVMVSSNGEQWKSRRNQLRHLFTTNTVRGAFPLAHRMQDRLMAKFDKKPGGSFDVQEEFLMYSFDYASNSQYGCDLEALNGKESGEAIFHVIDKLMVKWFSALTAITETFGHTACKIWESLPLPDAREYNDDQARCQKLIIDHIITPARAKGEALKDNILAELLKMDDPHTKAKLTDKQLASDLMDLYVAGYDTTGHTVAFTLFLLCLNPECMKKVAAEADSVLKGREKADYDDLKAMPYLDAVVKESARRYPASAGATMRRLEKPEVLDGVKLPKGTAIWVPVHALHNSTRLWESPHEFRPERWMVQGAEEAPMVPPSNPLGPFDAAKGMPGPFLTFIMGPRACLGQQLGYVHSKAILATFLHNYSFELDVSKTKPDAYPRNLFAMHFVEGLHMKITKR